MCKKYLKPKSLCLKKLNLKDFVMIKKILILVITLLNNINCTYAETPSIDYKLIQEDNHRIHIVKLPRDKFSLNLVSNNNHVFGRSELKYIAKQYNAQIAINAGFFEIGSDNDGFPSGALVIDGKIYNIQSNPLACLIKTNINGHEKFFIEKRPIKLTISLGGKNINIINFNKHIKGKAPYIFNDRFGGKTLSSYDDRIEALIDHSGKLLALKKHGNNEIPGGGYVLSFDKSSKEANLLQKLNVKDSIALKFDPEYITDPSTSVVMGLPLLVKDGKVVASDSFKDIFARTAIGFDKDQNYIIIVAEHKDEIDIKNLTLKDVSAFVKENEINSNKTTLNGLLGKLYLKIQEKAEVTGLNLNQLAQILKKEGAIDAINLDGGGSSALFMDGEYISKSYGDADEGNGLMIYRPVPNAIIFKNR